MLNAIEEIEEFASDDEHNNPPELQYVEMKSASEKELSHLTQVLLDEFDTLGICQAPTKLDSDSDPCMTVIVNGFTLVNNYRKVLAEMRNNNIAAIQLKQDKVKLEKQINALKQKIIEKDETIESINRRSVFSNIESEELFKENVKLQKELASVKKLLSVKSNEWEHKLQRLKIENDDLRGIAERTAGSFISKDVITANIIQKYKTNEESYKDIIKKLHMNNHGLMQHLINLTQSSEASNAI